MVRQQADLHTRPPYAYLFAFPANAWFAWREGVPVDAYDRLSPDVPRESFEMRFDHAGEKYLLDGWDAPSGDEWGSAWWIGRPTATIAVPLAARPGAVAITLTARTRLDNPPVQAALALDVNGTQVGQFTAGVPAPSSATITVPAELAARLFRRGVNHIALRSLGVARLDPADPRLPVALARHPNAVWPVAVYNLRVASTP